MPELQPQLKNDLRNKNVYKAFPPAGLQFSKSFFPHFTKSWNKLESSLQSKGDLKIFKDRLKIKMKPKRHKYFSKGSKKVTL